MATLAIAAAGAGVGSALLPSGISMLGTTMSGAAIGQQIGALAGSYVDRALFGSSGQSRTVEGARLADLHVTASTEGAPIPRLYGRARLGGQLIWATDFEEEVVQSHHSTGGGKGGPGGSAGSAAGTVERIEYRYYANIAVGIAEGPISGLLRVLANGSEMNLGSLTYRLYLGSEDQAPDSLIVAREGAANAPAYRGLAYIVFERMPIAAYGNRVPQMSFEINRAVDEVHADIRSVVLIPGTGEFAYDPQPVTQLKDGATRSYENVHTRQGVTNWTVALDQLEAALPKLRHVSLVVSWFGTDLRAGHCRVLPGVDSADKITVPPAWLVSETVRDQAYVVSKHDGRPAYGGTPADRSVVAAIRDLNARGLAVTLNPFILMDVPHANPLPDPYQPGARQPAYPWRGRITPTPAPGQPGSPDKTAAAGAQIAAFVGSAGVNDFRIAGRDVRYHGPAEWSFRRHILHYAWLARLAGGVDAFLIGSELRGLTQARDGPGRYPFVDALKRLAADVKSILGAGTKVTYGADWSEYFGHQPADGTGDVYFHLDPLWAAPAIDAIGIDNYWPLADWRGGSAHADAAAGARSIYDLDYLKSNIDGGEGYDWYYASDADRQAQVRSPITDGAGKPWIFRYKDLTSWWLNQHFDRPGGTERSTPTAWVPQSKPVWFLEIGCPATDKGANQPNVFVDLKSAESRLPHFSTGRRDDFMQRRYLQALIEAFDPSHPGHITGLNPRSSVYGSSMVDVARMYVYAWDARPFPEFPNNLTAWGDGVNWRLGHWLNGRISGAPLADVVAAILDDHGFADYDVSDLEGIVTGYVIDRIMSARDAIQALELAYFFDSVESEGKLAFRHRGRRATVTLVDGRDLVERPKAPAPLTLVRGQESELPSAAKLSYVSAMSGYRRAIAEARRLSAGNGRVAQADLAIVMEPDQATAKAATWLYEAWAARETASFTLPPRRLALEPGDTVAVHHHDRRQLFRITEITDHGDREIEAMAVDPPIYAGVDGSTRPAPTQPPTIPGRPLVDFIDLPLLEGSEPEQAGYVAATQRPWPGGVAIYKSPETSGFTLAAIAVAPATTGRTLDSLDPGPASRFDRANRIRVSLDRGTLTSTTRLKMLAGANAAAVRNALGGWEVLQFERADLIEPSVYRLSGLLRGQAGTEHEMTDTIAAGARFVLIDAALVRVNLVPAEIGLPLNWRFGPSDRDLGTDGYDQQAHAFRGVGNRPLSPVHLRGVRDDGDLTITWIRRTRKGGDSWYSAEVPLGEERESYQVEILNRSNVVRTFNASSANIVYRAEQQIADFGQQPPTVAVRVYQTNAAWGRGPAAEAVL